MKKGRQSSNIEDRRVTPRDVSMGMDTTYKTQAAKKGNRPRYDKAISSIRQQSFDKVFSDPGLQDMLNRMNKK